LLITTAELIFTAYSSLLTTSTMGYTPTNSDTELVSNPAAAAIFSHVGNRDRSARCPISGSANNIT
jgi:hypothetical protein